MTAKIADLTALEAVFARYGRASDTGEFNITMDNLWLLISTIRYWHDRALGAEEQITRMEEE